MMKRLVLVAAVLGVVVGGSAFGRDIVVGAGEEVKTLQGAFDLVPAKNKEAVRIVLKPGRYEGQVVLAKGKEFVTLVGEGKAEQVVVVGKVKASDMKPDGSGTFGTTGSATFTESANNFTAENVTFENAAGDKVGQAVAIKTNGDRLVFKNCRFLGYQDTLYPAGGGRVYFKECFVRGNTDFIFGNATAVFDKCVIESAAAGLGYVTAANTAPESKYGYVFLDCVLKGGEGSKPGTVWLGRPWQWDRGSKAAVAFVRTKMGPQIKAEGWHPWEEKGNVKPGETTRYSEFGSMDLEGKVLDVSKRVGWSKQLSEEEVKGLTVKGVLGGADGWEPG